MSNSEDKKLHLHIGKEAPRSPYVIDLRREELRASDPLVTPSPIDPLLITSDDTAIQRSEDDFTDREEMPVTPVLSPTFANELVRAHEEALEEAFVAMDLPDFDTVESYADEADVVEFFGEESGKQKVVSRDTSVSTYRLPLTPFHRSFARTIAAFVGLSFVLVLPIHAMQGYSDARQSETSAIARGASALQNFTRATAAAAGQDFTLATTDFDSASNHFAAAEATITSLSGTVGTLLAILPGTSDTYTTSLALTQAGERLAKAGGLMTSAMNEVRNTVTDSPVVKLDILTTYLERAEPLLSDASERMDKVESEALGPEHQALIAELKTRLPELSASVHEFLTFNQTLRALLGADGPMRYLVLFQNNTELRPTGGFLGSYAEMTVADGKITGMTIPGGGTYDLQGSLSAFVKAPRPIQLLNARWEFQDGNWFPDFPTSAKKLLWFYEMAGGPTVDGVIAVNATYIADVLALLGPIDMPEYDRTIDTENFLFETQKIVELEYDQEENRPKQFIADLAPKLLDRVTNADTSTFLSTLQAVGQGLNQRDIQLYFTDDALMKTVYDLGWAGEIRQTDGDYLMIVDTNLGGGKTDTVIDQDITLDVSIDAAGEIINTVTIGRAHRGIKNDLFSGVNNVDYLRLYVPQGAILLNASGDFAPPASSLFEDSELPLEEDADLTLVMNALRTDPASGVDTWNEFGKEVFGGWVQTKPGSTSRIQFTYRLPFTIDTQGDPGLFEKTMDWLGLSSHERYTLFIQKQPGVETRTIRVTTHLADTLGVAWSSDDALFHDGMIVDGVTDAFAAVLFK